MKVIFLSYLLVASAGAQTPTKGTAPTKTPAGTATHRKPLMLNPAAVKAKAPETYRAKFTTTKGDFVVEVTRAWAPLGADRFYNLVKGGYFDDASFFRVVPGFVVQFGIPAKPAIGRAWAHAD